MKDKDELIYDLIFSEKLDYEMDLADYVDNIYKYDYFIDDIKMILKKSKVKIVKSLVTIDSKTATWKLKVNK